MASKQTEIQKKEQPLPPSTSLNDWGPSQITSRDMVIPKILPLQFMSEKVKNEEGKYGEFRDTLSNQKFGDLDTPFEVIPFLLHKKWLEFEMIPQKNGGTKREYVKTVMIQDNPALPGYNDELALRSEDGKIERDRVMDFFVLIPSEVEKGEALPYVLSFRRTSLKAGQKLATQMFVRNAAAGKVPPATVMEISAKTKENDDGEFAVQDCAPKRPATAAEMNKAFEWYKTINRGGVKVDDREFEKEAPVGERPIAETGEF